MARELGWIRQFQAPRTDSLPPLLVFPHAGAGASAYRVFAKRMSEDFDTGIVQYPGRQDRLAEPAAPTLPELAAGAFEAFRGSARDTGAPLTVFGHSMGSIAAFEFVRLAESAGLSVRLLVVSAAAAPHRIAELPAHPTEDEELLDHMAALNGTGADVMASREVMRMALPVLKADYRAFDAYSCGTEVRIGAPVLVLGGDDDPFVGPRDLYGWEQNTSGGIEVNLFAGGHFYIDENLDGIAEVLAGQALVR